MVSKVMNAAAKEAPIPWTKYEHPQLGPAELADLTTLEPYETHPSGCYSRNAKMVLKRPSAPIFTAQA